MSILIKGMEMPRNCAECPFRQIRYSSLGKIMDCGIFGGTVGSFYKDDYDVRNIRHPKCPLVEIPKHGDIDRARAFEELEWLCANDVISRQDAIDCVTYDEEYTIERLKALSSAESDTYNRGWKEGREALRKEIWEDGRDRLD